MSSPVRTKHKFETFVMTGDTIIKTRSVSSHAKSSQLSLASVDSRGSSPIISTLVTKSDSNQDLAFRSQPKHNDIHEYLAKNTTFPTHPKFCTSKNIELDIPPDDISSEDELYREANVLDIECLPPPPDDFLVETTTNSNTSNGSDRKLKFLTDDIVGHNTLNRHRSYEFFDADGKSQDLDKHCLHVTSDVKDQLKTGARNYKSHENYLQLEQCVEFVPIVFDEAGAVSVDALNYKKIERSCGSLEYSPNQDFDNTFPEQTQNEGNGFSLSRHLECQSNTNGAKFLDNSRLNENSCNNQEKVTHESNDEDKMRSEGLTFESAFPSNSLLRNTKDADLPSAQRLAKRLYTLDGFQQIDVAKHLGKKDSFSVLVGQEYLKNFDFNGQELDEALRCFLGNFTLVGETQERERVLGHFSHRFVECNKNFVLSEDSCHTLICAMMLLNIDHHSQNIARKMTLEEFIENLSLLNDGKDFPRDVLKGVYCSVCNGPFECPVEDPNQQLADVQNTSCTIGNNPFLSVPDSSRMREYKRGFVMRKCCVDPDGHKTSLGKRGWRMFYATLRDLVLYLHKDEHGMKRHSTSGYQNHHNAIRIHHALAEKATDYNKKQHVFRLTTSDSAQYLFQTSDITECQSWMNYINFVVASLSASPLPCAVGSQKKFQRPLMPSSYTKLNLPDQLMKLSECLTMSEKELIEHRRQPPEKGMKSRIINEYLEKENFLTFEVKRFKTYRNLLQSQLKDISQPSQLLHQTESSSSSILQDVIEECNPPNFEENSLTSPNLTDKCFPNFQRSQSDRCSTRPAFAFS